MQSSQGRDWLSLENGSSQGAGRGSQIDLMCLPAGEVPFYLVHPGFSGAITTRVFPSTALSATEGSQIIYNNVPRDNQVFSWQEQLNSKHFILAASQIAKHVLF